MPEIEYPELEALLDDLRDELRYGRLSGAVVTLGILSRYVEGLVEEEKVWKKTEAKIIEERKK